ncbi:hypothetical protein BDAP_001540 [Binucleata daphniae]
MDETYDANFGDWIRNEENARIVAHNLKKYVKEYSTDKFIVCLKYIVKDWTLRSIITLVKKIFDNNNDIYNLDNQSDMIEILQGLVYTWNSIFISEFVISLLKNQNISYKIKFCKVFFDCFTKSKIRQILVHMENKIEIQVKETILENTNRKVKAKSKKLIKAYQIK